MDALMDQAQNWFAALPQAVQALVFMIGGWLIREASVFSARVAFRSLRVRLTPDETPACAAALAALRNEDAPSYNPEKCLLECVGLSVCFATSDAGPTEAIWARTGVVKLENGAWTGTDLARFVSRRELRKIKRSAMKLVRAVIVRDQQTANADAAALIAGARQPQPSAGAWYAGPLPKGA